MVRLPGARRDVALRKDLRNLWYFFIDDIRLALLVIWVPLATGVALIASGLGDGPAWQVLVGIAGLCLPILVGWFFYYRQPDPHPDRDYSDDVRGRHQR